MTPKFILWHFVTFPFFTGFTPQLAYNLYGSTAFVVVLLVAAGLWIFGRGAHLREQAFRSSENMWGLVFSIGMVMFLGGLVGLAVGSTLGGVVVRYG